MKINRLKRIIKEELDEYMIDNLARLYFGTNPENRGTNKRNGVFLWNIGRIFTII